MDPNGGAHSASLARSTDRPISSARPPPLFLPPSQERLAALNEKQRQDLSASAENLLQDPDAEQAPASEADIPSAVEAALSSEDSEQPQAWEEL